MALATPPSLIFSSILASTSATKPFFPLTPFQTPLILIKTIRLSSPPPSPPLRPCFALQEATAPAPAVGGEEETETPRGNQRQKLYVANLPWSFSVADIETLFAQCGTVKDVEVIVQKSGRSRGFAFVTMGNPEEAQAAIDIFDSYELLKRIIRVEYAKGLKKPAPPPPEETSGQETRHLIYVSNLAWKVRSNNLRDSFSASFKPVSVRVVFDSPSGKSAGYGFVSFSTKEEAEAAVSELNGKELMGRPLRLKISEKKGDESSSKQEVTDSTEVQAS